MRRIVICSNTSWYLYNFRQGLICGLQREGKKVTLGTPERLFTPQRFGKFWGVRNLLPYLGLKLIKRGLAPLWGVFEPLRGQFFQTFSTG